MTIGVPRERQDQEYRVALVPAGIRTLSDAGHTVIVETGAGRGSGFGDAEYEKQGAAVVGSGEEVYGRADLVVKVKAPLPSEYPLLREGQVIFSYFHCAGKTELTEALIKSKVIAVAYEGVREVDGSLPLLIPMSDIAGRMAAHLGAQYLQSTQRGPGLLLGRTPGVEPPTILILGGGTVGKAAAEVCAALGTNVVVLELRTSRINTLAAELPANVVCLPSNQQNIERLLKQADLLINATHWQWRSETHLVTRDGLELMKPGSVIIDVSADLAGAIESSVPQSHSNPTYFEDGILHYCVANIPGAVPKTATQALTNATLPYVVELADRGVRRALQENLALRGAMTSCLGQITYEAAAKSHGVPYVSPDAIAAKWAGEATA